MSDQKKRETISATIMRLRFLSLFSSALFLLLLCVSGVLTQDGDCDYPEATPTAEDPCTWVDYNLPNADFEDETGVGWFPIPTELYTYSTADAHSGLKSIEVALDSSEARGGAYQVVQFQPGEEPTEAIFQGWSKAKDVSGSVNKYYSLECRATNGNGELQGIYHANFTTGTQDWNMQQIVVDAGPDNVISMLVCTCLFQFKTGLVYFDTMSLKLGYDCAN